MPKLEVCSLESERLFSFEKVDGRHPLFPKVEELFKQIIAPLYGDQTNALKKIEKAEDRECKLLMEGKEIKGVLVYKLQPSNEFAKMGVTQVIEIKTLFVVDPENNRGRGFGDKLLTEVLKYAKDLKAGSLLVTVSEKKPESCNFFTKRGFRVIFTEVGRYQSDIKEFFLARNL